MGKYRYRLGLYYKKYMSKQLGLVLALLVCYLSACASSKTGANTKQSTMPVQTVAVTVEVVTLGPSPTPVICTSLPKGMTLSVKPISSTALQLKKTGFQAGESLIIILCAQRVPCLDRRSGWAVCLCSRRIRTTASEYYKALDDSSHAFTQRGLHRG